MKINKLRIKNINSLKNEHSIDFTVPPLSNSGLFAITGPTGSGKTTILDAICLALFNRIPRINSAISKNYIEETGVVMTKNTKEAFAEVEFACAKGIYTSRWEISTNRNGNLRDYEMRLFDNSGNVIEEKKTNVPASVESLIGLNFEQFTRSILLPQGDFALFLKSGKHERGKLLEKITGSSIYRELGKKAYQKSQEIKNKIEQINERIGELTSKRTNDNVFAEIQQRCLTIEKEQIELQEQTNFTKRHVETKQTIQRLANEAEAAKKQWNDVESTLKTFNEIDGIKVAKHQQLSPYFTDISNIQQLQKQIESSSIKIKTTEIQLVENQKSKESVSLQIEKFTVKLDEPTGNLLADLDKYEKMVKDLVVLRQQKEFEYRTGFEPLARFSKDLDIEISIKEEPQKISEKISLRKQATLHQLSGLEQKHPQIVKEADNANIERLQAHLSGINEWDKSEALKNQNTRYLEGLTKKQDTLVQELDLVKNNVSAYTQEYEKIKTEFELKSKDLIISKLQIKLDDVRQHLKSGEPCPVCGSTEHPWEGIEAKECSSLETEVSALEKEKENAKSRFDSETAKLQLIEKQKINLVNDIAEMQSALKEIVAKIEQVKNTLPENAKQQTPKEALAVIKTQIGDFQQYIKLRLDLEKIESIKSQVSQLLELFIEGRDIREQIQHLYSGTNIEIDCKSLKDSYINLNSEQQRLDNNLRELNQETEQTKKLGSEKLALLLPKLKELDYESFDMAVNHILPPQEFTALVNKKQLIEQNLTAVKTKFETLHEQWLQKKKEDIDVTENELTIKLTSYTSKLKELVETRDSIREQLTTQNAIRKELERFEKELVESKQVGEKWLLLEKLIGDATGNKFNNFAQALTLKHLINQANRRMSELNPRYRLELSDAADDDAINVVDLDMGNQTRSVKTLSGGETFLVSLALALGLADMASRNIAIGSLFIDEGFGTLDPETLDQALAMLESLQSKGNKTIGIISHVETLKERIHARIDLVPVIGHGYSKIVMIP
jgi:exonuclease SbcC